MGSYYSLHNSKIGRQRKARREAQRKRDWKRGMAMLEKLRPDQVEHVRHLLRSWCGVTRHGRDGLSESNIHMPICRKAIARTLNDRP